MTAIADPPSRAQLRAARAWLGMTCEQVSIAAGLAEATVSHLEIGSVPATLDVVRKLQAAFEARGVVFLHRPMAAVVVRPDAPVHDPVRRQVRQRGASALAQAADERRWDVT